MCVVCVSLVGSLTTGKPEYVMQWLSSHTDDDDVEAADDRAEDEDAAGADDQVRLTDGAPRLQESTDASLRTGSCRRS